MAKYKDGDRLELYFDDYNHPEYIRGWVTQEHAQQQIDHWLYGECKVVSITHRYGFFGVGLDEMGLPSSVFYERDEPGRGRFKVTEVEFERVEAGQ